MVPTRAVEILGQELSLSAPVATYLETVATETGRSLSYEPLSDLAAQVGIVSGFKRDPERVVIQVSKEALVAGERIEYGLSHEATHGLLAYRDGYAYAAAVEGAPKGTIGQISLMMTMLDDLVVNRRLADAGLTAYLPSYINNVKKDITALGKKNAAASRLLGDAYQAKFKVFQYITAWGVSHLLMPPLVHRKVLAKFLKRFAEACPAEHGQAREIVALLEAHDPLTAAGHRSILEGICQQWGLTERATILADEPFSPDGSPPAAD